MPEKPDASPKLGDSISCDRERKRPRDCVLEYFRKRESSGYTGHEYQDLSRIDPFDHRQNTDLSKMMHSRSYDKQKNLKRQCTSFKASNKLSLLADSYFQGSEARNNPENPRVNSQELIKEPTLGGLTYPEQLSMVVPQKPLTVQRNALFKTPTADAFMSIRQLKNLASRTKRSSTL